MVIPISFPWNNSSTLAGAIIPQFMVLHTPAIKERARISRKRKCIIDDMIVLPNEYVMVAFIEF